MHKQISLPPSQGRQHWRLLPRSPTRHRAAEPGLDSGGQASRPEQDEHDRIVAYWTPQRMRSARPADVLVAGRDKSTATGKVAAGAPTTLVPQAKPGGGKVVATTGKVFFSIGSSSYDGSDIAWCYGTVIQDTFGGSSDQGLNCNMTGGSSGGPWFVGYNNDTGVGTLNSVNSFKYSGGKFRGYMWGPYFGSVAQSSFNLAQGL